MKRLDLILLFLLGMAAVSLVAVFQHTPGYVDAEYYFAGGLRLAEGYGFTEPVLWNYLDDPAGLPHPSHAYWMPLASLLAALGMIVTGQADFSSARLGFLFISACIPPVTAVLSYSLCRRRDLALLSGLLAVVPSFYLSYLGTTDNFGVYIVLGALWLIFSGRSFVIHFPGPHSTYLDVQPILLGATAGLMHLARADGLIWLGLSLFTAIWTWRDFTDHGSHLTLHPARFLLTMLGYLAVTGPWLLRNLSVFGTPLSPGGGRTLWLTSFNEMYVYPASLLTPAHWWSSGLREILQTRLYALGQNLLNAFAVQGNVFLTPLILLGLWRLRGERRVRLGLLAWLATLFAMSAAFPTQGWRGGFFHSGAALQALFWASAPVGLDVFIAWGERVRNWQPSQARRIFGGGLVLMAVLVAGVVVKGRVIGADLSHPAWDQSFLKYQALEIALQKAGAGKGEIVAVNNPAGYFIASGRPAIVIPDGNEVALLNVARRYKAGFVLLDKNHPAGLDVLFKQPKNQPGLDYIGVYDEIEIYRVSEQQ